MWPTENYFPTGGSAAGFVNCDDGNRGIYELLPSNTYKKRPEQMVKI